LKTQERTVEILETAYKYPRVSKKTRKTTEFPVCVCVHAYMYFNI